MRVYSQTAASVPDARGLARPWALMPSHPQRLTWVSAKLPPRARHAATSANTQSREQLTQGAAEEDAVGLPL